MTHHHHAPEEAHPSPGPAVSLLRMSAATRLVAAGAVAAVLWLAVWWATG
jgi:hypothetical protein